MTEETDLRRLLVLQGPSLAATGVLDFLREHFEVEIVGELDSALVAMRERRFDAVLAETSDFLPLERGVVTQQASVVLDTIGDGVCLVGPGGELVWSNRRAKEFPQSVLGPLRKVCMQAYEEFATAGQGAPQRGKRYSLMPSEDEYYEVICSPVRDGQGLLRQVAAVVVNATSQRSQQRKLNAIERAGQELVRLDRDALRRRRAPERLDLLVERIIGCSRDVLDYQHFAVLVLDERTNRLDVVVSEGLDEDAGRYELFASTEHNGICGYVAATGRSYICPDVRNDPRYLTGLKDARSTLTVPLRLQDRIVGVLNVEADTVRRFGEEDRQFAEIFANYVAMALNVLDLLVFERHDARTQVSGSFSAELAGPINDIITEISRIMEDYIGHDDLRSRLNAVVDLATEARGSVQRLSRGMEAGVLPDASGPAARDPVLEGKRVLVADDEDLIRQTVHDVLAAHGAVVDAVCDGTDAIERIGQGTYDLVISDIKMPGADGYEVFAAAKAACGRTAVILITGFGYDPGHAIVRANREGLATVLFKPFKVRQLLQDCRAALTATES